MGMREISQGIKPGLFGPSPAPQYSQLSASTRPAGSPAATKMASAAVIDTLVPICVGQYAGDADRADKLVALKKVDSWKQADYVIEQGWATMPGATEPHNRVAILCASQITS